MNKINKITTDGNHNIILQDVNANDIIINVNDSKAIEKLIADYSDSIEEILSLLKQKQEPVFQQFADRIINIREVQQAKFDAKGASIDIGKAEQVIINREEENRVSRYVKYVLLFFVLPASFTFLLYWYFILSKPFSTTVTVEETEMIPDLPFKEGTVTLQYGDKTEELPISKEAIFKQIPANLKGKPAHLRFVANGYLPIDTTIKLQDKIILPIRHDNSLGEIFGMVKDEYNQPLQGVTVSVKDIKTVTDERGFFSLKIPYEKQAEEQRLMAYKKGHQLWDRTIPVVKDVETKIILRKKINK